jgi:RNA polymerase sigma factor (sigma-70 family)
VTAIVAGDLSAVAQFYEKYRPGLKMMVGQALHWTADVDDVVQQALLLTIAAVRAGKMRDGAALPAYVRTVAYRLVSGVKRDPIFCREDLTSHAAFVSADQQYDEVVLREYREIVNQTMMRLKPRDREILRRFYLEEQSPERICSDMMLSPTQFRSTKYHAKKAFARVGRRLVARSQHSSAVA